MHIEHAPRRAPHRQQRDRTGAVIGHLDVEIGQLHADVIEDSAGADRTRRVAGVERHQRL